jgi:hypothetical protein
VTVTSSPVGEIPRNSPRWVPRAVQRLTTLSPWAIRSSTAKRESGKAKRYRHELYHTLWAVHVSGKARIVEKIVTGEEVFRSFEVPSGEHLLESLAD